MSARETPLGVGEVTRQLRQLGVQPGSVLLVHTSFRAVRPIENGPLGLLAALRAALGAQGTLVMPSWSDNDDLPFDARTTDTAADLGVLPALFWRQPDVLRSQHDFAFAALGPQAAYITSDPLPLPPHIPESPVGRVHELDGYVLLLGVNHDANTTLHLAEVLAGVPYRLPKHITGIRDGQTVRIDYAENDHCGAGFLQVDGWLRDQSLQMEGTVGRAPARLVRARDIVAVTLERLRLDPLVFLHPETAACAECNQARQAI